MKYLALFLLLLPLNDVQATHLPFEESISSKPVFIHSVYFWLHDHVTESEKQQFMDLLKNFKKIRTVTKVYVGPPAGTPRAIVDNTYDVALIVQFKDKAGHDYYQTDQIHTDAIKIFEGWIKDIRIYDMISD